MEILALILMIKTPKIVRMVIGIPILSKLKNSAVSVEEERLLNEKFTFS